MLSAFSSDVLRNPNNRNEDFNEEPRLLSKACEIYIEGCESQRTIAVALQAQVHNMKKKQETGAIERDLRMKQSRESEEIEMKIKYRTEEINSLEKKFAKLLNSNKAFRKEIELSENKCKQLENKLFQMKMEDSDDSARGVDLSVSCSCEFHKKMSSVRSDNERLQRRISEINLLIAKSRLKSKA